jgi:hypothetical protein
MLDPGLRIVFEERINPKNKKGEDIVGLILLGNN